jgi:exonuclease VII large subunit
MKAELFISNQKRKLDKAETVIRMADPLNVLKKGYAMLYNSNQKVLTQKEEIEKEKILLVRTQNQLITTEIKQTKPWQK